MSWSVRTRCLAQTAISRSSQLSIRDDQDRVIFTGSIEGTEELGTSQVYRRLLQAHLRFCKRYRFATNLCRDHFIYCDKKELKGEDEVMVVKVVMPAEDIVQIKESDLPDLERGQMESTRCQASEAHALITNVVRGKKKWRGVWWRSRSTNPTP